MKRNTSVGVTETSVGKLVRDTAVQLGAKDTS